MARTYLVNDELDPISDGKVGAGDLIGGGHSADTDAHHAQQHTLDGADHTVSGLTTGHVLQATSATTFAFATAPAGTPASTVTDETSFGVSTAVGSSTNYAREDHTHGSPTNPVTAHTADASAHHAKYTDAEALAAAEAEATFAHAGSVTTAGDITPTTNDTYDLGVWNTGHWADVYARWGSYKATGPANTPGIEMYRDRTGATTLQATDWIGEWDMYGWDGVSNLSGPGIYGQVDSISVGTMTSSLHFRDGAWADTWYINNDGDFIPGSTTKDIGASGTRVQDIYSATLNTSGNITVGGTVDGVDIAAHAASSTAHHTKYTDAEAITAVEGEATLVLSGTLATGGVTTVNGDILPASDSTYDIGSSSVRMAEVHADKFILPSGTSFPGTPATGDKFIRTNFRDGDLVWFYNGTYWLTERYFEFHFKHEGAAVTGSATRYQVLPLDCDVWVMDADIMRRVNSNSESVTVRVREQDYDGTTADLLSSTVAPGTAQVWHRTNHTIDTLLASSAGNTGTTPALLRFEKNSTTNVSLADGTVRYRLRLT